MDKAKRDGMSRLAIMDHGVLCGAPDFYRECRESDIEPILGEEFYFTPDFPEYDGLAAGPAAKLRYHVGIMARDAAGFKVLCELSTAAQGQYHFKPMLDRKLIELMPKKDRAKLVVLSGCAGSIISQHILNDRMDEAEEEMRWWAKKFPHFYVELMHHKTDFDKKLNAGLVRLAKKLGLKWVITNDPHYAIKDDACHHDVILAISTGSDIDDPERFRFDGEGYWLKSPAEMRKTFKQYGQGIWLPGMETTNEVADLCHVRIPEWESFSWHIPKFPKTDDATKELRRLAEKGLKKARLLGVESGEHDISEYRAQMEHELAEFEKIGMEHFLLITEDVIRWARSVGMRVGPGRGSICGSVVAFLIGIHKVDPIYYDLLFERFLNPDRPKMPDVDTDYPKSRRQEVLDYYPTVYGVENTMPVAAFGTMQAKKTFKSIAGTHGMDWREQNKWAKKILEDEEGNIIWPAEVMQMFPDLIDQINALIGLKTNLSSHPAGMVIFDPEDSVRDYCPEMWIPPRQGKPGRWVMQYNLASVDKIGLLKQDNLALRTLDTIEECVRLVKERRGIKVEPDDWWPGHEKDDDKVFRMLASGDTSGVFQMEGGSNTMGIQKIKCREFEDIVACFPPETKVNGPTPLGAVRRRYEGDLVELTFASGNKLTVTPNHPMLRGSEWVAAGDLQVGDNLFRSGLREGMAVGDPDVQDRPISIGEVFDSISNEGQRERVPFRDVNLYGDRPDTDVDVVRTNRLLRSSREPATVDELSQIGLALTDLALSFLPPDSSLRQDIIGERSTSRRVSLLGERLAFFGGHLAHPKSGGFGAPSDRDAKLSESDDDMRAGDTVPTPERLRRFAGEVTPDEIVGVDRFAWSGHVLTLKTVDGWYLAEGVVAGNCTSLYRAGPMMAGAPDRFLKNRKDGKVRTLHKSMKKILKRSWGEMIYDEQMFQLLNEVAGFSWSRVDDAKTAMKKKKVELMAAIRDDAVAGFMDTSGMDEATAEQVWKMIAAQASYLFNRSHAVAYSITSYQTARLKYLYPLEYFAALLRTVEGKSDADKAKRERYMKEAVKMGFVIEPPDINVSDEGFMPDGADRLLFGLQDVAKFGPKMAEKLAAFRAEHRKRLKKERKKKGKRKKGKEPRLFNSVDEVYAVLRNQGVVDNLAACGALRSLGIEPDIAKQETILRWQFEDRMIETRKKVGKKYQPPKAGRSVVRLYGELVKIENRTTKGGKPYLTWTIQWKPGEEYKITLWSDADEHWDVPLKSIVSVKGKWNPQFKNVSVGDGEQIKVLRRAKLEAPAA